jgi:uncharacterized protein (TIGR03435 family)
MALRAGTRIGSFEITIDPPCYYPGIAMGRREERARTAGLWIVVAWLAVTLGLASHPAAQSLVGPAFEVVSVRPSNPDAVLPDMPPVGGRFTASNAPLRRLVQMAYEVFDFQIDGGPEWQTSRRFDIQAKAADPVVGLEAMRPMLKAVLADRFQLKVHTEAREMPIYALVVSRKDGQLGARITPSTADCSKAAQDLAEAIGRDRGAVASRLEAGQGLPCAIMPAPARVPGGMTMRANGASMTDLARFLTPATGRMVQDRTGLSGRYDWEMTFDRAVRPRTAQQPGSDPPLATPPLSDGPSLMTALQEQLGLKLESAHGPVEMLVIDSAALPKEN